MAGEMTNQISVRPFSESPQATASPNPCASADCSLGTRPTCTVERWVSKREASTVAAAVSVRSARPRLALRLAWPLDSAHTWN